MNFKKIFSLVLIAVFMVISTTITSAAEHKVKRENPKSILILGDSIASGYGLEGYENGDCYSTENYGSMLAEKFGTKEDCYKNLAVDGQTSAELAEKIRNGSYDEFLGSELIIISIGGNDLLSVLFGDDSVIFEQTQLQDFLDGKIGLNEAFENTNLLELSLQISSEADLKIEEFKANMPEILTLIKQKNPDAQIVVQNLYNPMQTGIEIIDQLYANAISKLNTAIWELTDCIVCDVATEFSKSSENLIQYDYTHPNASGHKVIFEAVSQTVCEKCEFFDTAKTQSEPQPDKNSDKKSFVLPIILLCSAIAVTVFTIFILKNRKKQP